MKEDKIIDIEGRDIIEETEKENIDELIEAIKMTIESRNDSLKKDEDGLKIEIEKEKVKSAEKTYIQEEFENDLVKVQSEMRELERDSNELKELEEKKTQINTTMENAEKSLEKLKRDKESLESEIKNLEGKSEFIDGKLQKTTIQQEYERDLEKVTAEITAKEEIITSNKSSLEEVNKSIKELADKYNVKIAEKEETQEQNETETPAQETPKETEKAEKEKAEKEKAKKEKWQIENVAFTIENGNEPTYKVILSNGKEQKEVVLTHVELLGEQSDKEEINNLEETYGIKKANKYYDKRLATVLYIADFKYGTDGLRQYRDLLKNRKEILDLPDQYEDKLNITYDFSGYNGKPNEEIRKLQKLAKRNALYGVVSEVKRLPNALTRFFRSLRTKMHTKQITKGEEEQTEIDSIRQAWNSLHDEPEFDINEFIKTYGLTKEEANKYISLQEEFEAKKNSPRKSFLDSMKVTTGPVKQCEKQANTKKENEATR